MVGDGGAAGAAVGGEFGSATGAPFCGAAGEVWVCMVKLLVCALGSALTPTSETSCGSHSAARRRFPAGRLEPGNPVSGRPRPPHPGDYVVDDPGVLRIPTQCDAGAQLAADNLHGVGQNGSDLRPNRARPVIQKRPRGARPQPLSIQGAETQHFLEDLVRLRIDLFGHGAIRRNDNGTARVEGSRRYLFGDPMSAPTITVVYISPGNASMTPGAMTLAGGGMGPQPVLEVLPPNEYDGVRWRLLFDVAIRVTDSRGAYYNAGA